MAEYISVDEPVIFAPKIYTYFTTLISLVLYLGSFALYLFALLILLIPGIREGNLNWVIISLALGYLIIKIAGYFSHNYGPLKLKINQEELKFQSLLGRTRTYPLNYILHIDIKPRSILKFLPPNFDIYTTDNLITINSINWQNSNELVNLIDRFRANIDNIYVKNAFHKNSFKNTFRKLLRSTQGKIGTGILLLYTIMAIIGIIAYLRDPPVTGDPRSWILFSPDYQIFFLPQYSSFGVLSPPNRVVWFGTDYGGRDIFSRMIFGTTITMAISIFAAILITILITIFGLSSAIYGGTWDSFITRVSDVLLTFPQVVWIVLISVFSTPLRVGLPGGFFIAVYIGMSFVMWPLGARLVRSEVLEALNAEYVQAIELVGAKRFWVLRKHIFPKVVPTIFLLFFYQLSDIIIGISLLGYLGFGSESTTVWGSDLAKAFEAENIQNEWWTIFFPSLFIFGIVFGLTLFSDALRDSYASKFRGGQAGTLHSSMGGKQ